MISSGLRQVQIQPASRWFPGRSSISRSSPTVHSCSPVLRHSTRRAGLSPRSLFRPDHEPILSTTGANVDRLCRPAIHKMQRKRMMTKPHIATRFSADNSALLLIDHQVGTMQLIKNIDRALAAKQSIALAKWRRSERPDRDHVQPGRSRPGSHSPGNRGHPPTSACGTSSSVPAWSTLGLSRLSRCGTRHRAQEPDYGRRYH